SPPRMQAQLVLHHLLPRLLRQSRVCSAPWPATAFDVALAFLSPVSLSPVFLDLARKSGLPDLRTILRNPGKPGFTMLRNPGKPGFTMLRNPGKPGFTMLRNPGKPGFTMLRNPGKPGFTMLRNPGKPGFRWSSPWSDG